MTKREKNLLKTGYELLETSSLTLQHPCADILDKLWRINKREKLNFELLYEIKIVWNERYYSFTITLGDKILDYVFSHHKEKICFFKRDPNDMEKDFMFYAKLLIES